MRRAAHLSRCARCGAGAACSAINYQSLGPHNLVEGSSTHTRAERTRCCSAATPNGSNPVQKVILIGDRLRIGWLWDRCRESRRCSRDTYLDTCITKHTSKQIYWEPHNLAGGSSTRTRVERTRGCSAATPNGSNAARIVDK